MFRLHDPKFFDDIYGPQTFDKAVWFLQLYSRYFFSLLPQKTLLNLSNENVPKKDGLTKYYTLSAARPVTKFIYTVAAFYVLLTVRPCIIL